MSNCGIDALGGIIKLKNISMYTLLQLAKDNGMDLYFCKVDPKDLPIVKRPAILHSNNHFVLALDNKPLPEAKYTGWVLTPKPMGKPMAYTLAKQVTGGKKGGDILGPIVTGVASIINPGLGAVAGAAFNIHKTTGGAGVTPAKGEFWRIPLGAASGYLGGKAAPLIKGIDNAVLAGGVAGAAELPGAIKSGNYAAPLTAALGGYAGQKITSGAAAGFNAPSTGVMNRVSNTLSGAIGRPPSSSVTPSTGSSLLPGAPSGAGDITSGVPSFKLSGVLNQGPADIAGGAGASALPGVFSGGSRMPAQQQGESQGLFDSLFGGQKTGDLLKQGAAALAGGIMKKPKYEIDSMGAYDKASQYLEGKSLPSATNQQLNRYLSMPIQDIQNEILGPQTANRSMLELDNKYEQAIADVQRRAANSGQSIETSSDAREQYNEIQRQWGEAKANLWGELEGQARQEAIGIHKWALEQSLKQGEMNMNSAMELAAMVNKDRELKYAIETQNYDQFQKIIAQILGTSYEASQSQAPSRDNLQETMK